MDQLKYGKQKGAWLNAYFYCRVFPLEKTKNGFYKCRLSFLDGKKSIEWVIPAKYLEENGHVEASQDVYFARFRIMHGYEIVKDENGEVVKTSNGEPKIEQVMKLGRMIDFWNTRVYGVPSDAYLNGLED